MRQVFRHNLVCFLGVLAMAVTAGAGEAFIPVVAQSAGAAGSFWNTELWIANPTARAGSYGLVFLPAGRDNSRLLVEEPRTHRIAPGATVHLNDVVPPNSVGALRVVTSDGLIVRCRVFNTRGRGSAGQLIPLLTVDDMIQPGTTGVLVPLLRGGQFRTNIGVFNPAPGTVPVRIEIRNEKGETVGTASYNVEAGSQLQLNDALLGFRINRCDGCEAFVTSPGPVAAYATFVDNRSGSATFVRPAIR